MTLLEQKSESIIVEITRSEARLLKSLLVNVSHNIYGISTRRNIIFDKEAVNSLINLLRNLFEPIYGRLTLRGEKPSKEAIQKRREIFQETKLLELTTDEVLIIQSFMEHVLEDKEFNSDIGALVGCSLDTVKNLYSQIINFLK